MPIIQHNILAMNAGRQFGIVNKKRRRIQKSWHPAIRSTGRQMMRQHYQFLKRCGTRFGI